MRFLMRRGLTSACLALLALIAISGVAAAAEARLPAQPINPADPVDHDAQSIAIPKERDPSLYGHQFRESVVEPLSRAFDVPDRLLWLMGQGPRHEAANVNAYDEVSNSTWFTNRNHVRALTPEAVRLGGADQDTVPTAPLTIKSRKSAGVNAGFTVKDAKGLHWIVKLDRPGYPQLGSGADVVVARLFWAAGYNVPHDVAFTFRRSDLKLDDDLRKGKGKTPPFGEADLDSLLQKGARAGDGRYYAQASEYLEGKPVGPIDMRSKRPDDPNDIYRHRNRRELRGLYVLCSWVGSWDTKDQQSLDTFIETGGATGYVDHNLLDFGASLGAGAEGPRLPSRGYEYTVDGRWTALRFVSLGFVKEPWRRIPQAAPIPALGNFESQVYQPDQFKSLQPHAAFRERGDGDDYWGAKLVASFSDAQIGAAIDAAGYEDPRVKPAMLELLIERRNKVMRYYFDRVAPLDFFHLDGGELRFRDLAVDRGIAAGRTYEVQVEGAGDDRRLSLQTTALALSDLGPGGPQVDVVFHVAGSHAKPVTVTLRKGEGTWTIARIRHA